jgi:hypothetical protein
MPTGAVLTETGVSASKPSFAARRISTDTVLEPALVTARSARPLPSKSAATMPFGLSPTGMLGSGVKPGPSATVTLSVPMLLVARSVFPSPLKSPAASARGVCPVL